MDKFALVFCLSVCVAFGASMRLHDSAQIMDWDRAVEYCRSLDAYVPPLNAMEAAFRQSYVSAGGKSPYQREIYWTSDQSDLDGAYAYNFASGLHSIEFKASRFRVMCIQSDFD
ncbi:MAG: hypothetical protein LBQ52_09645 [Helicobacteraceae bacterium]|nr:hypothetical protein [Helicobacteraceae bacterium]